MNELVTITSEGWVLHGVVHVPPNTPRRRIGVVLTQGNGANTKFGPHGMFRKLSDALAQADFYVLRYDTRGSSDSAGVCDPDFFQRVADGLSAISFFRKQYDLDAVVGWGLCMGAATAVYCASSAQKPEDKVDALVLCNILTDPLRARLSAFTNWQVDPWGHVWRGLRNGSLLRKLLRAPDRVHVYLKKLPKLILARSGGYRNRKAELNGLRKAIGGVARMLADYPGPCLLVFGDKDNYYVNALRGVDPGGWLGLAKKTGYKHGWALVRDGDHVFASTEQTTQMIRYTLEWLDSFRKEQLRKVAPYSSGEKHGILATPIAD